MLIVSTQHTLIFRGDYKQTHNKDEKVKLAAQTKAKTILNGDREACLNEIKAIVESEPTIISNEEQTRKNNLRKKPT